MYSIVSRCEKLLENVLRIAYFSYVISQHQLSFALRSGSGESAFGVCPRILLQLNVILIYAIDQVVQL